jgi:phage/plasmid-like protein (TIGR03299 family)
MAHEITSTDKLVLTGRPAWHGLGTVVQDAPNVWGALDIAHLGWKVLLFPLIANAPGGSQIPVPNRFATVREDTSEVLGIVSNNYRVAQNVDVAKVIDALGDEGVCPRMESAGSLRGGRDVFFLVRAASFMLGKGKAKDEVEQYVLFTNSHDGLGSFGVIPTTIRVVCKNTHMAATTSGEALSCMQAVRHVPNFEQQLKLAADRVITAIKTHQTFREAIEALAAKPMSKAQVDQFFADVFASIEGETKMAKDPVKSKAKAVKLIAEWDACMSLSDNTVKSTSGTAWQALNAVSYWADHLRKGTVDRNWSNLVGPGHEIKLKATGRALALVS